MAPAAGSERGEGGAASEEARPRLHAAPGPLAAARERRRAPSLPSPPPPSSQHRARRSWRCSPGPLPGPRRRTDEGAAGLGVSAQNTGFQGGRKNGQGEACAPRPPFSERAAALAPKRSLVQEGDITGRPLQDHSTTVPEAAEAAVPAPSPGRGLPGSAGECCD